MNYTKWYNIVGSSKEIHGGIAFVQTIDFDSASQDRNLQTIFINGLYD